MKNNIPECPICFKNCFETLLCRTPCAHKICMDCMLVIQKYECPTCRGTLPIMNNLRYKAHKKTAPVANDVMRNGILLGCHQGMKIGELNYMCKTFEKFAKLKNL